MGRLNPAAPVVAGSIRASDASMTAASSFAPVFMRFPFASKGGTEDQAIGVPRVEPSEIRDESQILGPNMTLSGTKRQPALLPGPPSERGPAHALRRLLRSRCRFPLMHVFRIVE